MPTSKLNHNKLAAILGSETVPLGHTPSIATPWATVERMKHNHERLMAARDLLHLCCDVIDDSLEERPARHSLGGLHARIKAFLGGEG